MLSKRSTVLVGIALVAVLALAAWLWTNELRHATAPEPSARASTDIEPRAATRPRPVDARPHADESDHHGELGKLENLSHLALPAMQLASASPHGALVGRVINWSTRRGIAGAELGFMQDGVSHTLTTASDGSYRFDAPSPGIWVLATLTADGFLPHAPELGRDSVVFVARPRREIQRVDLLLFPALDYVGTVVDTQGQPVSGAEIELFGADSGERAMVGIPSRFRSDAQGRFEFHAPDDALLEARHPDHQPGRARVDGAVTLSHTMTITLGGAATTSAASITGTITDADGNGIAGAELFAEATATGRELLREPTTTSAIDGSFVLGPLDEHAYVVVANSRGRASLRSATVEPGAHVELRMAAGHSLHGRIVDGEGRPVPVATVVLRSADGPLARAQVSGLSVFDPAGEFEFRELPEAEYELLAIAQGRPRSEPVRVRVPSVDVARVVLDEGARLHGQVVEAGSGDPLELALVSVDGLDAGESILPALSSTVTDVDGRFELVGVSPGRVSVNVAAFAHDGQILSGIELEPGETHGPLRIELARVVEGERPKTEISGIGVEIGAREDAIAINAVMPGGGAEAAGIVPGETIVAVDGVAVPDLGFENAVQNIRGQIGTTVRLELIRLDGSRAVLDVERRLVQTQR